MPERARIEVQEIGTLEIVLAVADVLEETGQHLWDQSDPNDAAETMCAAEYRQVCREAADGLREVIARLERRVQRHLDGPCKAH